MSARVCSPPMDLQRSSDMTLIPGCPSSSLGSNSLPSSAMVPALNSYYPSSSSSSTTSLSPVEILPARRNVSRNLFGSPDPRSAQFARDKIKEIRATDTKKWNFDFDREKPLDGRYKWEQVATEPLGGDEKSSAVPAAYACHRLPFIASASGSTKQVVSASSPSSLPINLQDLYYTPIVSPVSPKSSREPLLIVRHATIPSQSVSTDESQAGTAVKSNESCDQSTAKSANIIPPNNCLSRVSVPTSISSTSHSECFVVPRVATFSQKSADEGGDVSHRKSEDVKCKVQLKSTKQTRISDYMNLRKRKAPQQTTTGGEKKAAL